MQPGWGRRRCAAEVQGPPACKPAQPGCVQVCILDCKAYEELMEAGETEAFANIDNCVILTGNQSKGLLHPGPGEDVSDDKKLQIQLQEGEVRLCPHTPRKGSQRFRGQGC